MTSRVGGGAFAPCDRPAAATGRVDGAVTVVLPAACPDCCGADAGAGRAPDRPRGLAAGRATQVVSHGRHHHNRSRVVSGLNAPAGSPQNRHSGPPPAGPSIHPVELAVAACIPSNLGVRFTPRPP
jgi:hypothetical protein